MKRITVVAIVLLISAISLNGQGKRKEKTLWEKVSPPNGQHLYDSVFIDETEIVNIHYLEYLHYLQKDSTFEFYQSQLPDSSCWEVRLQEKDSVNPYTAHYFRYPGFRYYPVVGVSYEQAVNYCKWRGAAVTKNYREEIYIKRHPDLKDYDITVEYRLPTKEEWEYAASGGLDKTEYPYGRKRPAEQKDYSFKIGKKASPCKECLDSLKVAYTPNDLIRKVEFAVLDDYYFDRDMKSIFCKRDAFGINYMYNFSPNPYHLYNMIGNVAEMTSTKGLAKGGSFRNKLSDFTITSDFRYRGPTEWLGFRCMAIVHLRKKAKSLQ